MEWRRGPSQARGDENVTVTNRPFVHAELAAAAGRGVGAAKRARHGRICIARPWNRNSECNRPADQNSEQVTDRLSTDTCCNARNQASLWRNVTRCSFAAARGATSPTSSSRAELPTAMRLASMPIRGALSAVSGAEPGLNKPGRVAVTVMSGQRIDLGRQLEQRTVNPVEATQALSPDRLCHNLLRPYHFAWASKLPFLGYERPWNAGYGSVSSARGWLTVIGRSAFRDDSTAN